MPPRELRAIVEDAITSRIDQHEWRELKRIEREEKQTLESTFARITKPNGSAVD